MEMIRLPTPSRYGTGGSFGWIAMRTPVSLQVGMMAWMKYS